MVFLRNHRGGTMKIKIFASVLLVLFFSAPFSDALDKDIGGAVSLNNLLDYKSLQQQSSGPERSDMAYFARYKDVNQEKFDLTREKGQLLAGYVEWSDSPSDSYTSSQNSLRPLVYDVSVTAYNDEDNAASFDMGFISSFNGVIQLGAAFMSNLFFHEFGHEVVANYVDAKGTRLDFFKREGDQFFLGTSTVEEIDERSLLPYTMGGEFFADLTFEHALRDYRNKPTTFNKSLMLASGGDFLWYCFYAYYLSEGHPNFDPISVSEKTGLPRDTIFSIVAAKTMVNAYRAYSGQDKIIPYFSVDKYSASLNVIIPIEIDNFIETLISSSKSYEDIELPISHSN